MPLKDNENLPQSSSSCVPALSRVRSPQFSAAAMLVGGWRGFFFESRECTEENAGFHDKDLRCQKYAQGYRQRFMEDPEDEPEESTAERLQPDPEQAPSA